MQRRVFSFQSFAEREAMLDGGGKKHPDSLCKVQEGASSSLELRGWSWDPEQLGAARRVQWGTLSHLRPWLPHKLGSRILNILIVRIDRDPSECGDILNACHHISFLMWLFVMLRLWLTYGFIGVCYCVFVCYWLSSLNSELQQLKISQKRVMTKWVRGWEDDVAF